MPEDGKDTPGPGSPDEMLLFEGGAQRSGPAAASAGEAPASEAEGPQAGRPERPGVAAYPEGGAPASVPPSGGAGVRRSGPPPQRGRAWVPWVGGGCIGCAGSLLLLLIALAWYVPFAGRVGAPMPGGEKVALIRLEGVLLGGAGAASLFGATAGSDAIVRQLVYARRDPSIKAVLLRINSPGGSAAAAQEIYEEVMRLRKSRKPVIASMGDVATSGGYYVACAADMVVANPATMTGSIGVIMELMNLQSLYGKIGIDPITIKSGRFKDIGSPNRRLTQEERRLLQVMVDDVYEQFVSAVAEGRKQVSRAQIRRIADGRVLTGRQALHLRLVDRLGNLEDALSLAARAAGIKGRPTVVELGRRGFLDLLVGSEPGYEGSLRLPHGAWEGERLTQAIRRLLQEQALPR